MSDSDSEASDEIDSFFNEFVTLGKSSDFETVIWRFPDTKICPLKNCMLLCSSRRVCMAHFQMHHAEICMICTVCDELFLVLNPLHLLRHYQVQHPNERAPKLKEAENIPPANVCEIVKSPRKVSLKKNDSAYKITMNGVDGITSWTFPDTSECTHRLCRRTFKTRLQAMEHFRDEHANESILCNFCQKPISVKGGQQAFVRHLYRAHPNQKIPNKFEKWTPLPRPMQPKVEIVSPYKVEDDDGEDDDLITLRACGITTKWRYPKNLRECLVLNCRQKFKSRSKAMAHFKEKHAIGSILCSICDRPLRCSGGLKDFRQHYAYKHPNHPVPFGSATAGGASAHRFNKNKQNVEVKRERDENDGLIQLKYGEWRFPSEASACPVRGCGIQFGCRLDAIIHYKQQHANGAALCHLCQKPIRIDRQRHALTQHFRCMHPDQEIPYGFGSSANQSKGRNFDLDRVKRESNEQNDEEVRQHTQASNKKHPNVEMPSNFSNPARSHQWDQANANNPSRVDNVDDGDVITLSACGVSTKYQFPQTKKCPVQNCRQIFAKRSDCIVHYKKLHAIGSVLCPICVHPIRTMNSHNLKVHYQRKHPTKKIPYTFRTENATVTSVTNRSDANESDVITLTSGSRITHWRFPKEKWQVCPAHRCHLKFETRSAAIEHFKREHSNNSICCHLCDKPIIVIRGTGFRHHYNRRHPGVKFPADIGLNVPNSQASRSPLKQIKEEFDDDSSEEVDGLINLTTCGITTQWLFPKHLRKCPVGNCHESFRTRVDGIKHYKKWHAVGSICCPVCDLPIRSLLTLNDFRKHYQNKHPHHRIPFETGTRGFFPRKQQQQQTSKSEVFGDDDEETDDVIVLSGLGQKMKWQFPKGLTRCPVNRCPASSMDRAILIQHYRQLHAKTAVFCELCRKPICTRNRKQKFIEHYQIHHPNVAAPFVDTVESDRAEVKRPKVELDSRVACDLCSARIEPEDMDQHLNEMHRTHRIFCPLKLCSYVAKQMDDMRAHWNREHKGMEFPEFRDETDFSYIIDTSKRVNELGNDRKIVHSTQSNKNKLLNGAGSSKPTGNRQPVVIDSSDSESSAIEENASLQNLKVQILSKRKKSSDCSTWFTGAETPNENYADGEPVAKNQKESSATYMNGSVKRRRSSSCSSICSSSTYTSANCMNTSRKVARKQMQEPSDDNIHESNQSTTEKPTALKECRIVLERLSSMQASNSNPGPSRRHSNTSFESLAQTVKSSTSTLSNQIIYITDSDEEDEA